jgi:hypothetical protein
MEGKPTPDFLGQLTSEGGTTQVPLLASSIANSQVLNESPCESQDAMVRDRRSWYKCVECLVSPNSLL